MEEFLDLVIPLLLLIGFVAAIAILPCAIVFGDKGGLLMVTIAFVVEFLSFLLTKCYAILKGI